MSNWKDTIEEILTVGEYTLITYIKGGDREWNCCRRYNRETKTWAAGNYAYSLEGALATCLKCMRSKYLKSDNQIDIEEKTGITYERMSEFATLFKDIYLGDEEADYVVEDMTDEELEYFGIKEGDEDYEED